MVVPIVLATEALMRCERTLAGTPRCCPPAGPPGRCCSVVIADLPPRSHRSTAPDVEPVTGFLRSGQVKPGKACLSLPAPERPAGRNEQMGLDGLREPGGALE